MYVYVYVYVCIYIYIYISEVGPLSLDHGCSQRKCFLALLSKTIHANKHNKSHNTKQTKTILLTHANFLALCSLILAFRKLGQTIKATLGNQFFRPNRGNQPVEGPATLDQGCLHGDHVGHPHPHLRTFIKV